MGRNPYAITKAKEHLEALGFANVVEVKRLLPGNMWPKGRDDQLLGASSLFNLSTGLHGYTTKIFDKLLGWSMDEIGVLLQQVQRDLRNVRIHFYREV
ncbi:hypothetical protein BX600DRAFT_522037 [Xylariales sp. PMI_506]|nr:hypothetical protein BX600DRAFT_522037 [Xylariales sp. PMI_506]